MKHRKGPFSEDLRAAFEAARSRPFRPAASGRRRRHPR